MNSDQSISWLDIELDQPLSEANHQAFVQALNESVRQIVDQYVSREALANNAGVRVILPSTPAHQAIEHLSFICAGFKHHGIPLTLVVRSTDSLEELVLPDSTLFNKLAKELNEKNK